MDYLHSALSALLQYKQFIIYQLIPRIKNNVDGGKKDKLPIDYRTGQLAAHGAHDPAIWVDAATAINYAKIFGADFGVGFVFTDNDPFWFLDIDDCLAECGTQWSTVAQQLMQMLPGAAIEVSSSGRGLHIFGSAREIPNHTCRNEKLNLEFYHTKRFVALTGFNIVGNIATDLTDYLPPLINTYFKSVAVVSNTWTEEPHTGWRGPTDDQQLISRALRAQSSRSVFGDSASFSDLWDANYHVLQSVYSGNESSYDAALAQHLAFWTGNDCERMQRLMLQSKLVREKWQREDYLPRTILSACAKQTEFLNDKPTQTFDRAIPAATQELQPTLITGNTFLSIEEQIKLFTGCVYICDDHRVLIPGGKLLNQDRFNVWYGGRSFPVDLVNQRVTRHAWEAFTQSQVFEGCRVNASCFRPLLPPAKIIQEDDQKLVNLWWPIKTPRMVGDAQLFLNHLNKIIPNETDRQILLSYLAACVQYPGVKFQWAPFIQGVQGNGKTLFTRCVAQAIGYRYSHFPKASEITSKFNSWMYGKLLIGVEDIYTPHSQREVLEELKTMITGEFQEIEGKGENKVSRDICCNFIINSNHKDGVRKISSDRRFAPFYTLHQSKQDLINDDLHNAYFLKLYNWLREQNGYAIVSEFLYTYEILDEFNPATHCKYAPTTTSTASAIEYGMGAVEQEIVNAIEQDDLGFRGGWVSSHFLDLLLQRIARGRIPQNKRRELLQSIGYDWHPILSNGRVNNVVFPDGAKSKLFIKQGHLSSGALSASEVAKLYTEAQNLAT